MGWLSILLGLADPISKITGQIVQAKISAQNATTEQDRIAADERAKALAARRDVLIAEAGSKANVWIRGALALPVAIILWKVFVYDKAFGQWTGGHTDALDDNLWRVVMVVLGFYFLYEVTRTLKR